MAQAAQTPTISFSDAAAQIRAQGGTDADVQAFAQEHGIAPDEVSGIAGLKRALHVNPELAGVVGSLVGGTVAAPGAAAALVGAPATAGASAVAAPLIEMGGIGLGYAFGKQAGDLWNKYALGEPENLTPGQRAAGAAEDVVSGTEGGMAGASAGVVASRMWERIQQAIAKAMGGNASQARAFLAELRRAAAQSPPEGTNVLGNGGEATPASAPAPGAAPGAAPATPASAVADNAIAPGTPEAAAAADMGRPKVLADLRTVGADTRGALPMTTDNPAVLGQWDALRKNPETAKPLAKAYQDTMSSLERSWGRTLSDVGDAGVGKEGAGLGAKTGVMAKGEAASAAQSANEAAWAKAMGGPETPVVAARTETYLDELARRAGTPAKGGSNASANIFPSQMKNVLADIRANNGEVPLQWLRDQRTWAGENGSSRSILPGEGTKLDGLYEAMTQDMEDAARAKGGPALQAWNRTQSNWQDWKARAQTLRTIATSPDGLAAYKAAFAGDRSALTRLRTLRGTLETDQWNDLMGAYLKDQSTNPRTGQFDLSRWYRNWGDMDPAMKDLIARPGSALRTQADAMQRIGSAATESGWLNNFSNTASGLLFNDALGHGGVDMLAATRATADAARAAGGDVSKALGLVKSGAGLVKRQFQLTDEFKARLLMDPTFQKWIEEGTHIPASDTPGVAQHLQKLGAMIGANEFPDRLKMPLAAYLDSLGNWVPEPQSRTRAAAPEKRPPPSPTAKQSLADMDTRFRAERDAKRKPGGK